MSLPIVTSDQNEKWDCHQCGFCCRGSLIPLSESDMAKLKAQQWNQQAEFKNVRLWTRYPSAGSGYRLAHRPDGSCVFLNAEGLCSIHAQHGIDAKPIVCQTFPLQLVPRDKQAVLTIRRACPSAAGDLGEPLQNRLSWVKEQVKAGALKADAIEAPYLRLGHRRREWKTIRAVLDSASMLLNDQRFPPVRRLVHALQFAGLLDRAKTRTMSDAQISELAFTLVDLVPDEAKPFFETRQPPKLYSRVMFRLMTVDCARLHPECKHTPRWSSRLDLVQTAWKAVTGAGTTQAIGGTWPRVPLKDWKSRLACWHRRSISR